MDTIKIQVQIFDRPVLVDVPVAFLEARMVWLRRAFARKPSRGVGRELEKIRSWFEACGIPDNTAAWV